MRRVLMFISRLVYLAATFALLALSLSFIAYAAWSIYQAAIGQVEILPAMLSAVGLIIIALAVSDVGRFLLEEDLAGEGELDTTQEVRRTLSKFITIIIIAAGLESLVFLFEAGKENVQALLYPAALLIAVAVLLGVLGLYQRLAHAAEHERRMDNKRDLEDDPEKASASGA